jgi:hypothetical protein
MIIIVFSFRAISTYCWRVSPSMGSPVGLAGLLQRESAEAVQLNLAA